MNGEWVIGIDNLLRIASYHFRELFTASEAGDDFQIFGLVERRISDNMNAELLKLFTSDEIWQAIKMMPPLKASSINGFPALFYQRYWHIFCSNISDYCLSVLNGESSMDVINKTHIVLLSKVDKPKNIS